jgi:hypothetical protein
MIPAISGPPPNPLVSAMVLNPGGPGTEGRPRPDAHHQTSGQQQRKTRRAGGQKDGSRQRQAGRRQHDQAAASSIGQRSAEQQPRHQPHGVHAEQNPEIAWRQLQPHPVDQQQRREVIGTPGRGEQQHRHAHPVAGTGTRRGINPRLVDHGVEECLTALGWCQEQAENRRASGRRKRRATSARQCCQGGHDQARSLAIRAFD